MKDVDFYNLGRRDAYAEVLAEAQHEGVKLKWIALDYEKMTGERHFSHEYHTS